MTGRIEIAIEFCDRAEKTSHIRAIHFASGLQTTGSVAVLPCLSFRRKMRERSCSEGISRGAMRPRRTNTRKWQLEEY